MGKPRFTIELYRVNASTGAFTKFEEISTYRNLSFYNRKNGIGAASFDIDIYDPQSINTNWQRWRTQIVIKDHSVIIWVGTVSHVAPSLTDIEGALTIECVDYIAHLSTRFSDAIRQFEGIDAGLIAWGLIDDVQNRTNGELGFVQGTIETTTSRDRTYEYKNLFDAIYDLTQVSSGFDFKLTYNVTAGGDLDEVAFNVFSSLGSTRNDLSTLEFGVNVLSAEASTQNDITNTVTGLGAGTGENILTDEGSDAGSQVSFTRRELILTRKDVSIFGTLEGLVNERVAQDKDERYHINVNMMPGTIPTIAQVKIGDTLNIDLSTSKESYFDTFVGTARVLEAGRSIDETGAEFTTYKLDFEV